MAENAPNLARHKLETPQASSSGLTGKRSRLHPGTECRPVLERDPRRRPPWARPAGGAEDAALRPSPPFFLGYCYGSSLSVSDRPSQRLSPFINRCHFGKDEAVAMGGRSPVASAWGCAAVGRGRGWGAGQRQRRGSPGRRGPDGGTVSEGTALRGLCN